MRKNKNLIIVLFFIILLGCGLSFMQYQMLNVTMNLILTVIGLIGTAIFGRKLLKEDKK